MEGKYGKVGLHLLGVVSILIKEEVLSSIPMTTYSSAIPAVRVAMQ
jgi:hypothetical protein